MKSIKSLVLSFTLILGGAFCASAKATIVQFETSVGNFEVNLYDEDTPQTVANFLAYVNAEAYNGSIIHRSIPGFVIQGGGFIYDNAWPVSGISSNAAVVNEPVFSNVRGTIAMAKLGNDPNSATNQWFFNLVDNSENLDRQNEGFTVFGEVTGDGMAFVDQIADLPLFDFSGTTSALGTLPLQNYTAGADPDDTNLIIITRISVIDATVNSAEGLNPPTNIGPVPEPETASSSGGGAISTLLLGIFALLSRRKIKS